MTFFNRISTKLIILALVPLVCFCSLILWVMHLNTENNHRAQVVIQARLDQVQRLDRIMLATTHGLIDTARKARNELLPIQQAAQLISVANKEIVSGWEGYQKDDLAQQEKTLVEDALPSYKATLVAIIKLEQHLQAQSSNGFRDYVDVEFSESIEPFLKRLGRLTILQSQLAQAEFSNNNAISDQSNRAMLLVMIIMVIIISVLAFFVYLAIQRPVLEVLNAVHNLADGEGDLTQRIVTNSSNEVGELAGWLNKFVEHLDDTFSELIKSAMRLIPMSEELSEGNIEITKTALDQNEQINNVRARLQIAQNSTDHVQAESELILSESHTGAKLVEEGIAVFEMTYQQINELGNIIGDASTSIDALKSESDKIVSVIDVINSIAEQTNLLALNAAIEAARAGDAGRGFAVVADEVRALALRTRESTLEVSSMVDAIQSGTDSVVGAMSKGKSYTDECNSQVGEAKEKLTFIYNAMTKINDRVESISTALVDQKDNFNRVSEDFDSLDKCFNNSQKASDITVQIGVDMSKMSFKLHGMVNHFKLTDSTWSTGRRNNVRVDKETVDMIKSGINKDEDADEIF
jgi:methyl-accepting chemotaxis protein